MIDDGAVFARDESYGHVIGNGIMKLAEQRKDD